MTHAVGSRLDGIADVESMRMRCVCDAHTGCWHLRTARGRPMSTKRAHVVWVYGVGLTTATRAMWQFHTGKPVPADRVVLRRCDSYDCVNPAHLRCGRRRDVVALQSKRGSFETTKALDSRRRNAQLRAKLTPELRAWAVESPQSGMAVAFALDVSQFMVWKLRKKAAQRMQNGAPSVFHLGDAMNLQTMRRAA